MIGFVVTKTTSVYLRKAIPKDEMEMIKKKKGNMGEVGKYFLSFSGIRPA